MKTIIGNIFYALGIAMIFAVTIRAIADMLHTKPFNFWVAIFALGCILLSIGIGLRKK